MDLKGQMEDRSIVENHFFLEHLHTLIVIGMLILKRKCPLKLFNCHSFVSRQWNKSHKKYIIEKKS